MTVSEINVVLANPRGFCAGVDRAIEIVEKALEKQGSPIYVRHDVVHNRVVVEKLREKGAVFVQEIEEIPEGATVIFSAHGVSRAVKEQAAHRNLKVFDATCPLVTKVHVEVKKYRKQGLEILLIGHIGHPEVEGTMGQIDGGVHLIQDMEDARRLEVSHPEKLAYVSQTTLSVDDTARIVEVLRQRFPAIRGPHKDDICYATQNRQDAVKNLAPRCDVIFVVGSPNSSNSNRLREIAEIRGVPAYLIDGPQEIQEEWLRGKSNIGVTAGASAPESLVTQVIKRLNSAGVTPVELDGPRESVVFSLPVALRN